MKNNYYCQIKVRNKILYVSTWGTKMQKSSLRDFHPSTSFMSHSSLLLKHYLTETNKLDYVQIANLTEFQLTGLAG